jgi:hypothetical protein
VGLVAEIRMMTERTAWASAQAAFLKNSIPGLVAAGVQSALCREPRVGLSSFRKA